MMRNEQEIKALSTGQLARFLSNLASCYNCPALRAACIKSMEACEQAWADYLKAESETGLCRHEKVYENSLLLTDPPQRRWICRKCGEQGTGWTENIKGESYDEIKRKSYPGCAPE